MSSVTSPAAGSDSSPPWTRTAPCDGAGIDPNQISLRASKLGAPAAAVEGLGHRRDPPQPAVRLADALDPQHVPGPDRGVADA